MLYLEVREKDKDKHKGDEKGEEEGVAIGNEYLHSASSLYHKLMGIMQEFVVIFSNVGLPGSGSPALPFIDFFYFSPEHCEATNGPPTWRDSARHPYPSYHFDYEHHGSDDDLPPTVHNNVQHPQLYHHFDHKHHNHEDDLKPQDKTYLNSATLCSHGGLMAIRP